MKVTFFGVRGSVPSAGAQFTKYGGNTACVHLKLNDGTDIILDSGTGIIGVGEQLKQTNSPINILLTHNHWDHIQGFPFFMPAYQPNRVINIVSGKTTPYQPKAILEQMSGSWFPVEASLLLSDIRFIHLEEDVFNIGSARVERIPLNHPNGGSAYLITEDGISVAYVTDNELSPPYPEQTTYHEWVDKLKNVDLLIHDAQYVDGDMPIKHGWGHSLTEQTVQLALHANVKKLALYSHDNTRTDVEIDQLGESLKLRVGSKGVELYMAYEGLQLEL